MKGGRCSTRTTVDMFDFNKSVIGCKGSWCLEEVFVETDENLAEFIDFSTTGSMWVGYQKRDNLLFFAVMMEQIMWRSGAANATPRLCCANLIAQPPVEVSSSELGRSLGAREV